MLRSRLWVQAVAVTLLCTGCVGPFEDYRPTWIFGDGSPELSAGIKSYDQGKYAEARKNLTSALDDGLTFKSDRIKAHKYLAFIYCVTGKERQCRDEFRKVLEIDPNFELQPAEAGHPLWGPVFRSVKKKQ